MDDGLKRDIRVTVEMSADVFDEFRVWQAKKEEMLTATQKTNLELKNTIARMATEILNGLGQITTGTNADGLYIRDQHFLIQAYQRAGDYFA